MSSIQEVDKHKSDQERYEFIVSILRRYFPANKRRIITKTKIITRLLI